MPEASDQNIVNAARAIERGELVAFPTETVYGLGADAENADAVAKIFALKGRPQDHPVIVHITDATQLSHWAREVPAFAHELIKHFWPGPLTLVLNKQPGVADACTGGQGTIGLRCPAHPVALALLREFKQGQGGIAAPSANKFGKLSPTTAQHVRESFGETLPILDGGACEVGIESTIVDGSRPELGAVLLRPGMLSVAALRAVLGATPLLLPDDINDRANPRVSGALPAHYQPDTPLRLLLNADVIYSKLAVTIGSNVSNSALLCFDASAKSTLDSGFRVLRPMSGEPALYAQHLYANLRELDKLGLDCIYIELPPLTPEWLAIHDRLKRAAHR